MKLMKFSKVIFIFSLIFFFTVLIDQASPKPAKEKISYQLVPSVATNLYLPLVTVTVFPEAPNLADISAPPEMLL